MLLLCFWWMGGVVIGGIWKYNFHVISGRYRTWLTLKNSYCAYTERFLSIYLCILLDTGPFTGHIKWYLVSDKG